MGIPASDAFAARRALSRTRRCWRPSSRTFVIASLSSNRGASRACRIPSNCSGVYEATWSVAGGHVRVRRAALREWGVRARPTSEQVPVAELPVTLGRIAPGGLEHALRLRGNWLSGIRSSSIIGRLLLLHCRCHPIRHAHVPDEMLSLERHLRRMLSMALSSQTMINASWSPLSIAAFIPF